VEATVQWMEDSTKHCDSPTSWRAELYSNHWIHTQTSEHTEHTHSYTRALMYPINYTHTHPHANYTHTQPTYVNNALPHTYTHVRDTPTHTDMNLTLTHTDIHSGWMTHPLLPAWMTHRLTHMWTTHTLKSAYIKENTLYTYSQKQPTEFKTQFPSIFRSPHFRCKFVFTILQISIWPWAFVF